MGSTDRPFAGTLGDMPGGDLMEESTFIEALSDMGLTFHKPAYHHRQIREDGKVLVDWWPNTGTCHMHRLDPNKGPIRGPKCLDFDSLLAWLRSV